MIVTPSIIRWGSYGPYEGPWYPGSIKYSLPLNPTKEDLLLEVITATEGGCYDAVNMYDRCILSTSLIQLCEAEYFLTTKLLNKIASEVSPVIILIPLRSCLEACDAEFKKNNKGLHRFFQHGKEVVTISQQKELFLGGQGLKGSWTPETKQIAINWAAGFASLLRNEASQKIQRKYCGAVLNGVTLPEAKQILFTDVDMIPSYGWPGAVRAVYISFAANLPEIANKHLQIAVKKSTSLKYTQSWCIEVIQQLTFGPNIKIYSERYEKLVPVVERQYGISLPKDASSLKGWKPAVLVTMPVELEKDVVDSADTIPAPINQDFIQDDLYEDVKQFPAPPNVPTDLKETLIKKSLLEQIIDLLKQLFL